MVVVLVIQVLELLIGLVIESLNFIFDLRTQAFLLLGLVRRPMDGAVALVGRRHHLLVFFGFLGDGLHILPRNLNFRLFVSRTPQRLSESDLVGLDTILRVLDLHEQLLVGVVETAEFYLFLRVFLPHLPARPLPQYLLHKVVGGVVVELDGFVGVVGLDVQTDVRDG